MSAGMKFLTGLGAGTVALIGGLALLFVALDQAGRLKAPAFANRLSFDEKVRHLRHQPPGRVEVVLAGSSTTLHGIDGAILRDRLGIAGQVLNLGVQGLAVDQTRFLAGVFLARHPAVAHVLMVSAPHDYRSCGGASGRFFEPEHVQDYLGGAPALYYHFRYLDLRGVLKRALELPHLRSTIADLESVSFDRHGSLLLEVPRERIAERVWRGDPIVLDPPCYQALGSLARDLQERGVGFTFVIAPMRPGYLAGRDPDGALLAEHRSRLEAALAGTGAIVIDAHDRLRLPEEAFFDALHLGRAHARALTRFVGERLLAELARLEPPAPVRVTGAGRS